MSGAIDARMPAAAAVAGPREREVLLVAAAIFGWLALTAGLRLLTLPDEGRYVGVAWEMLRSGDWLTPTLDGMPFFHKPPLFYWITAASLKLLGPGLWAARVASMLAAAAVSLALWLFLRRRSGKTLARASLAVLLVQPLFYIGAQFANLDMLVAGCIGVTIVLLAEAALRLEAGEGVGAVRIAAWAMAALGVLAKGLIGFVLPAAVIGLWLLSAGRWRTLLRLVSGPGLALFLLIAAPWFLAMQQRFPAFLHYFFVVQHFQRFAAGGFNNVQPVWFYPALLALTSLPGVPALFVRRRDDAAADELRRLMWIWLLVVVGFFSLPQSKLVGYVLPAVPPLAVLIADGMQAWPRRWRRIGIGVSLALSVGVVAVLALHPLKNSRDLAAALRDQHRPGEPVYMLRQYAYDLPFYARLDAPVRVVDDWADPAVRASDNWRKELADARDFAPDGGAQLVDTAALAGLLCKAPVSYLLAETALVEARWPRVAQAVPLASTRGSTLWRVEASALDCPDERRPSAGSATR